MIIVQNSDLKCDSCNAMHIVSYCIQLSKLSIEDTYNPHKSLLSFTKTHTIGINQLFSTYFIKDVLDNEVG
jgi:hypothetical protein